MPPRPGRGTVCLGVGGIAYELVIPRNVFIGVSLEMLEQRSIH